MYVSGNAPQRFRNPAIVKVVGTGTSKLLQIDVNYLPFMGNNHPAPNGFGALRVTSFYAGSLAMITYIPCYPYMGMATYLTFTSDGTGTAGLNYFTSTGCSNSYPSSGVVRYSIDLSSMPARPAAVFGSSDYNHIIEVLI